MRVFQFAVLAVFTCCSIGASLALDASSTMAAWQAATTDEKAKLVTELLKQDGRENATAKVLKCLDATAGVSGHADLPIRQVVKACEKEGSEPV